MIIPESNFQDLKNYLEFLDEQIPKKRYQTVLKHRSSDSFFGTQLGIQQIQALRKNEKKKVSEELEDGIDNMMQQIVINA